MSSYDPNQPNPEGQQPAQPQPPYQPAPPAQYQGQPPVSPPPGYGAAASVPPPNYLAWAIVSIFLCWPLGIPATVFSTQVNSKWGMGDAAGAAESSRKAKQFALIATIVGPALYIIGLIIYFAIIAAAVSQSNYY